MKFNLKAGWLRLKEKISVPVPGLADMESQTSSEPIVQEEKALAKRCLFHLLTFSSRDCGGLAADGRDWASGLVRIPEEIARQKKASLAWVIREAAERYAAVEGLRLSLKVGVAKRRRQRRLLVVR
jgi:hypothetical protein